MAKRRVMVPAELKIRVKLLQERATDLERAVGYLQRVTESGKPEPIGQDSEVLDLCEA